MSNKYFKEPRKAKAKKLGAQQVMFWELLQKFRCPKDFLGCPKDIVGVPQAAGLLLGSSLDRSSDTLPIGDSLSWD